MAGRGGGRGGRGGASGGGYFNALKDNLNIAKGDKLISSLTPPPLFPPLNYKPVPLKNGDDEDYLQRLKQELTHSFRNSEYAVTPATIKDNAPTYSDSCQTSKAASDARQWTPDWTTLPRELYVLQNKKRSTKRTPKICPNKKVKRNLAKVDVDKTLSELENQETKEEDVVDEEKKEEDSDDEEKEEEEILDEEDIEEGTDYNMSYFDNGEDYADDEDDNLDDGPVY